MNQYISFGRQLMFEEFTNEIVMEPIKYWKELNDIPKYIIEFILNTVSSRIIYDIDTEKYHCSKCLNILDKHYYCSNCSKQCRIPISNKSKYIINTKIKNIKEYNEQTKYFAFDIIDGEVILYMFNVDTSYQSHIISIPYQKNKITIHSIYHITKSGLTNTLTNTFSSFKEYDENETDSDLFDLFNLLIEDRFLYTDNLSMLKYTSLYKYTSIWEMKDYYENENFTFASLTFYPIYFKEFEYLVKMKLYRLAGTGCDLINYKHNFKDTFGIDKKYYLLMKELNVDISELNALRIYPSKDIELLNFISYDTYIFEKLIKYISPDKLKVYFEKQQLDNHHIYEYYDYLKCCEYMGLDLKDKCVIFPEHFTEEHNELTAEMLIATNQEININIQNLSSILSLNIYEDEQYVIFPANSIESLIDESSQMSNCVRTYCSRMSNNECQIYFMRYKNNINKSLVTIEVRDGKIVQARTKFNELPTDEMNKVLRKWEKQIISVVNDDRLNKI